RFGSAPHPPTAMTTMVSVVSRQWWALEAGRPKVAIARASCPLSRERPAPALCAGRMPSPQRAGRPRYEKRSSLYFAILLNDYRALRQSAGDSHEVRRERGGKPL